MHLCLRKQHGGGRYRTPTSRFGVRDFTPRPPRPLEYMLTCGTKGHYILPLSDLSKTVIVMTRIPRMIHGIVQVLVSLWFYYLTRPSRKRIRVTKTPLTPHLYKVKLGFTEGVHYFLVFALKHRGRDRRKPTFWFPTRSNINRDVQLHKMARSLKFRI